MGKFFQEDWDYMDPGNDGHIEMSRVSSLIHRLINNIKMDKHTTNNVHKFTKKKT